MDTTLGRAIFDRYKSAAINTENSDEKSIDESAIDEEFLDPADVSILKTATPNVISPGGLLTYTIDVANGGPDEAQNVVVSDITPDVFLNPEYSTDGGITWQPWTGSYNIGTMPSGTLNTILIRGSIDQAARGVIINTATVTSTTPDPFPNNNSSTAIVPIVLSADLAVTKSASPDPVNTGDQINYTIDVTNFGPTDADDVNLTDTISPEILNPEYSTDGGITWQPWTGSYNIGSLPSGSTTTVLIRGTVDPSAPSGSIPNTANVTSTTPDPDPNNNTTTITTQVNEASADVAVNKIGSPDPVNTGDVLTYGINVSNLGPSDAENVFLDDFTPPQLLNPEYSTDGGLTWQPWSGSYFIGTLPSGDVVPILIRGTVDPNSPPGPIINTADVTSTTPDPNPSNNSSTVVTNSDQQDADIEVIKTASPNPVTAGDMLNYSVTVANLGPGTAQDVNLTDFTPPELLNPEYSTDGGLTWQPWTGSYFIGTMPSGDIRPILIRGTVDPNSPQGTMTNTADVTSTTPDPNPGNNSSTVNTDVNALADLSVDKTASPNPVNAGDMINYTINVTNFGPGDAQDVTLTDNVPPQVLNPEYSIDGGITWNPWVSPYTIGTMASGEIRTILIRGTVDPATPSGQIFNTATITSSTQDPDSGNNSSTTVTDVNALPADISVVKTGTPNPVNAGDMINYTIDVANAGPGDAQNVVLTDAVSPQLLNPEYSLDGVTWLPWTGSYDIGTLPSGATTTVFIRGTVDPTTPSGLIFNTANVTSTTPDPDPDNNTSTVITEVNAIPADLAVNKTANPSPVNAGDELTYTIDISNFGPGDAQDVTLDDIVPPEITPAEYSTDGGITWQPWPPSNSYDIGTLPSGTTTTILIRGKVNPSTPAGTIIVNTANVTSTTPDPDPNNNTSTVTTDVNALADVSVNKTGSPNPVVAGNMLNYTIDVFNSGPSDAQDVTLNDVIPPQVLNPEFSTDGGITWQPWTGSFNIGTLPAGASNTILIRGTVDPSTPDGTIISNTANITSTTPDPNPGNNSSTADIIVMAPESADVSVTKTPTTFPVIAGQILTYNVNVSNAGPSAAENVTLNDVIPPGIINPEYSTDGGVTWQPWTGSLNMGTLPPGASVPVLIRGIVDPNFTGVLINTANVTSTTPDPNPNNNTSTSVVPVEASADVSVVKTGNPDPVNAGDLLTYTINVSNFGPSTAQNVNLNDAIPSQITGAEYSTDGGVTWNPWTGSLNLGTLPAGTSVPVLIRGTVDPNFTGVLINTANVTSTTPDPNPDNNTSTEDTTVIPTAESADISVMKTSTPNPVNAGDMLNYTITVSNSGPSDAENVILNDTIPSEILDPEYSIDGGMTWFPWSSPYSYFLGTLPAGTSRTILIRGTVSSSTPSGIISNTANVTSTTPDPNPSNNTFTSNTTVRAAESANISVSKTSSPNPVNAGDMLNYTINVSNAGPTDAQNVVLTDTIPSNISEAEYSTDGGITWQPWTGSYDIGTLTNGDSRTILIRGIVSSSATGAISNTASVTSTTPDPEPDNNTSTTTTTITKGEADISITKTSNPNPVMPGCPLIYTITVSNAGPSDAQNVVLRDDIPCCIMCVEFSTDGGDTWNPWCGSYNIGTIPSGTSKNILIRGIVNKKTKCSICNTAKVISTTPDPCPTNNVVTAGTLVYNCHKDKRSKHQDKRTYC